MQATDDELNALLQIQKIDIEINKTDRKYKELPQRQAILELREKKAEVEKKKASAEAVLQKCCAQMKKFSDEDDTLAAKQKEIQAAIDSASGFRDVESRTKELNGCAKRRTTLETEMTKLDGQIGKAEQIVKQIDTALAQLAAKKAQLIESFKKEGTELQMAKAKYAAYKTECAQELDPALFAKYEQIREKGAGVAVGVLNGSACGVCRTQLEGPRLTEVKRNAPLATCPNCGRFIVVV